MDSQAALDGVDVCNLFDGLLVPPPTDDVNGGTPSTSRPSQQRAFVVNRQAGRDLCACLKLRTFTTISGAMQRQVLSLMDAGLRAGLCSAVRLRLSCENDQLVRRLLDVMTGIAAQTDANREGDDVLHALGRVLGMVCSAGVGVDELKVLLRALRVPSAMTRPLVEALAAMAPGGNSQSVTHQGTFADSAPAVRRMFDFNGEGAGLVLPPCSWPFVQEYQIAAWIRVESPAGRTSLAVRGKARQNAHLVTFITDAGAGVDYYLEDSHLVVEVADGKGGGHVQPRVVDMGDVGLIHGRWHALVIYHRRSNALLFNKDQLEVFLDGELVFVAPVPYPRHMTEPLTRCSIGWDLDGQTSGVLLFSGAAELKLVSSMLNRLARHVDNPCDESVGCAPYASDPDLWVDTATVSSQERLKRLLLGSKCRIFAALLPARTVNGRCLEPHNGHHALLRGDKTHVWITRTAQDVIRSMGGTPALLPLAHQLLSDFPGSPVNDSPVHFAGQNVDTVLSVLLSFLDDNVANQSDFFCAGGVEILEILLRSSPQRNFALAGAHTVMVLERMLKACRLHQASVASSHGVHGLAEHANQIQGRASSLEHQIFVCLMTNFSLWARAPPEFQFGLATSVLDMVRGKPEQFRRIVPVETVLTNIRVCCSDRISGDSGQPSGEGEVCVLGVCDEAESDSFLKGSDAASSIEREWNSMARRERLHVRGFFWEIVRLLLGQEIAQQDGDALVQFVARCDDARLVCELVQVLDSLMRQCVPPAGLFGALENASFVHQRAEHGRLGSEPEVTPTGQQTGFLALILQRCVLVEGVSEDLRVAGLRAANVFMARAGRAKECQVAIAAAGGAVDRRRHSDTESGIGATSCIRNANMQSKVSSAFPLLSEGLMRDRHSLGEPTYAAILEMALLGDEREIPWSEQVHVVGIVNAANLRRGHRYSDNHESGEGRRPGGESAEEDLAASIWWNCDSLDAGSGGGSGHVLDDAQVIRNVLPLALILQYLPTMPSSVQVRSHRDLLLMLKLNEANRQKVVELSHADGDRFWGIWERCLFLMMAPLFSRRVDGARTDGDEQDVDPSDAARKGDYLMVLKLYAILLEHTMSSDAEGYKEIALATSLQHLIPHGRMAARVLLAQLAFEVGQSSSPSNRREGGAQSVCEPESPSDILSHAADSESEQVEVHQQPRWNNMVQLAFIAANLVSDDVSTVTAGLFPEGEDVVRGGHLCRDETRFGVDVEAVRASSASTSIPFLLCSNPTGHGSLALSARVLGMFPEISSEPSSGLLELCAARSTIPGQGPLMFPLLRLSLFLLVRLHPFSTPAQDNLSRLSSLVLCLLSDHWHVKAGSEFVGSDDMCMVILAHVHAALVRLQAQAMAVSGASRRVMSQASMTVAGETTCDLLELSPALSASVACKVGMALLDLLQLFARRRRGLLRSRLGERFTGELERAINYEPNEVCARTESGGAIHRTGELSEDSRWCWDYILQSLKWMEGSLLFESAKDNIIRASNRAPALLEACMPSLKAAEELESRAVRAAGERAQLWQELVNRTAVAAPSGEHWLSPQDRQGSQVVEALRQEALKVETLRGMHTECRLLAFSRRLKQLMQTLSAAWSPWAMGDRQRGGNEPPGWEVSSHKDQLMRQMMLVPTDLEISHEEASYAGTKAGPEGKSKVIARDDGAHRAAVLMHVLKSSVSLVAGKFVFDNDDVEETEGEKTGLARPGVPKVGVDNDDVEEPTGVEVGSAHPAVSEVGVDNDDVEEPTGEEVGSAHPAVSEVGVDNDDDEAGGDEADSDRRGVSKAGVNNVNVDEAEGDARPAAPKVGDDNGDIEAAKGEEFGAACHILSKIGVANDVVDESEGRYTGSVHYSVSTVGVDNTNVGNAESNEADSSGPAVFKVSVENGDVENAEDDVAGLARHALSRIGVANDVVEEAVGGDAGSAHHAVSMHIRGLEVTSTDWEDISRPVACRATIDAAAVQSAASQHACDDLRPMPASLGGVGERAVQGSRGKWAATNVVQQGSVPGTLYLYEETLVFRRELKASGGRAETNSGQQMQHHGQTSSWRLERLAQLHLRRLLLSPRAVELFWADSPEVFLAFRDVDDRQAFTRELLKRNLPMLPVATQRGTLHPRKVLGASKLTELWRRREISNFQYIMELNVIAGRSYNDVNQYPVFPWVLSDYTSSELDLQDPCCFRDLSKPIGALNARRREFFMDRYESGGDGTAPFMYGSHYSNAGVVLNYLIRQEPFTSLHIKLQGGRFDCADRLFGDLSKCWSGCIDENNTADVRELTPEFFYFPEIFLNSNNLPLGKLQEDGVAVDDVRLPPWAKDAFDFVRMHRLALESEHVSQHLHHWIDLVFGYKQRGSEAVKAANVFHYLTYEGAVDLSQVKDANDRAAMEAQIRDFGQTPIQVLLEPHPVRLPPEECVLPLFSPKSTLASLRVFSPKYKPRDSRRAAALLVYCTVDRLVCVDASLRVTTWTWSGLPNGRGLPFTLGPCRTNFLPSRSLHMSNTFTRTSSLRRRVPVTGFSADPAGDDIVRTSEIRPLRVEGTRWFSMGSIGWSTTTGEPQPTTELMTPDVPAPCVGRVHSCFGVHIASEATSESILSCGYWDNVVRLHRVDSGMKMPLGGVGTGGHRDAITCLAIANGGSLLVTAGEDATCRVWVVGNAPMASALGGNGAWWANTTNASCEDSMVCVHVLYGHEAQVTCLAVSEELDAVVSGASDGRLVLHSLKDGRYVRQYLCGLNGAGADDGSAPVAEASQLTFSCHGDVVVHSWTDLSLHRFSLNGARLATVMAPAAISCLLTAGGGEYLLAGGQDGLIRVYTLHDLCVVHVIDLQEHGGVTCMRLSPNDEYLLAGSEDGEVSIITDARMRLRMLDLALRRAFVG